MRPAKARQYHNGFLLLPKVQKELGDHHWLHGEAEDPSFLKRTPLSKGIINCLIHLFIFHLPSSCCFILYSAILILYALILSYS
jgi:hypothetical protein